MPDMEQVASMEQGAWVHSGSTQFFYPLVGIQKIDHLLIVLF